MSHAKVAVGRLKIRRQKFQDEDFSAIEAILRSQDNITITQLDEDDMKFLMFGDGELDYRVLEKITSRLQSRKFTSFVLTAEEYAFTGEKYRHVEGAE